MEAIRNLRVIRRRWAAIAVLAALGAIAGFLLAPSSKQSSALGPQTYLATHTLLTTGGTSSGSLSLVQIANLANAGDVPERVAAQIGGDPGIIAGEVITIADPALGTLEINATGTDPEKTAELADTYAAQLQASLADFESRETAQRRSTLTAALDALQAQYSQLDPASPDPLVRAQASSMLAQIESTQSEIQAVDTAVGQASPILTLKTAEAVPITAAAKADLFNGSSSSGSGTKGEVANARTAQQATASSNSGGFNPYLAGILGAIGGALLGVALALAINALDPRIFTKEQAESAFRFPVIAEVPAFNRRQRSDTAVITRDEPYSRFAEAYRSVRSSIIFVQRTGRIVGIDGPDSGSQSPVASESGAVVIMVTSPSPSEGKTTTVSNLAAVLAEDGSRVLVVNCDFRRPRLHRYLHTEDIPRKVANTEIPGVKLISGVVDDPAKASPAEVLAAQRHVVSAARELFDYILLDTAPVLTTNDANDVLTVADMVVVIARSGKTTSEEADRAAELLERFGAPVIGAVLIGASEGPSSRYYYYYNGDGVGRSNGGSAEDREVELADLRRPSKAAKTAATAEVADDDVPAGGATDDTDTTDTTDTTDPDDSSAEGDTETDSSIDAETDADTDQDGGGGRGASDEVDDPVMASAESGSSGKDTLDDA